MPDGSWIDPGNHWALLAILAGVGALGLLAERTRLGARLSAVVVTMGGTFALTNAGVIPIAAPVYDVVWSYLVPLAIPLLLFRADLRRIWREAGPTLVAYAVGALGTVVGTVAAFYVVPLGEHGWQLAAVFSATYVGGSINYAAAAEAVGLRSGDLLSAGVAADNLAMAAYFLLLFALPSIGALVRLFPSSRVAVEGAPARAEGAPGSASAVASDLSTSTLATALALAAGLCALGYAAADWSGLAGSGILFVTAAVVALATFVPARMAKLAVAERVGVFLMQIFFATIGASAHVGVVLRVGPLLLVFAGVILAVHLVFLLVVGRLLHLPLPELVIASNANMGGPTTAAAMAVARGWRHLVIPAILCGTLGYAFATFLGVALGHALR